MRKALTRTIYESRWLGELAKNMASARKWATKAPSTTVCARPPLNTQQGSLASYEVHVWTNRPI